MRLHSETLLLQGLCWDVVAQRLDWDYIISYV